MQSSHKIYWLSYLRAIATIAVIIVHVTSPVLNDITIPLNFSGEVGIIAGSMVRWCVPVFLMITGALFLSRPIEIKSFIQKRFLRIILPLLFWGIIYSIRYELTGNEFSLKKLFQGQIAFRFWYLWILICFIYPMIMIFGKYIKRIPYVISKYYFCIWAILMTANLIDCNKFYFIRHFIFIMGYFNYCLLGMFILNIKPIKKEIMIFICILSFVVTILGYIFVSKSFFDYLSPNVLILSICVFLMFKQSAIFNRKPPRLALLIDKFSYGIYLVHIIILYSLLNKFDINGYTIHPIFGIPVTTVFCLCFSVALVYIISKIPFGKYISGSN